MALLALDAEESTDVAVAIRGRRKCLEIGRMTFETTRDDGTLKVCEAVAVAGAVYPSEFGPVGNRELEELIFIPEEVGLSFVAGADDNGEALGAVAGTGDGSLGKCSVVGVHAEVEVWIDGLEDVFAGSEFPQDGAFAGGGGGEVVRGLVEGVDFGCVTGAAGLVALGPRGSCGARQDEEDCKGSMHLLVSLDPRMRSCCGRLGQASIECAGYSAYQQIADLSGGDGHRVIGSPGHGVIAELGFAALRCPVSAAKSFVS